MNSYMIDKKALRKKMIDLEIESINQLAIEAGLSRQTIYTLFSGESIFGSSYKKLCKYLSVDPINLLVIKDKQ